MKLHSLNPLAWAFKPAPTQEQIILYELSQRNKKLVEIELDRIAVSHERAALAEQFQYLQLMAASDAQPD